MRVRSILRKRKGMRGRDRQRWPNQYLDLQSIFFSYLLSMQAFGRSHIIKPSILFCKLSSDDSKASET